MTTCFRPRWHASEFHSITAGVRFATDPEHVANGRGCSRRTQRGFTLLEILVTLVMAAILAAALATAFGFVVSYEQSRQQRLAAQDGNEQAEREITRMLTGAKLVLPPAGQTGATDTYFQAVNDGGSSALGTDRVTFTTTYPGVPMQSIYSTSDFNTQQTSYGPVGGLAEVSIGLAPVGQAPPGVTGLFERVQQPSDTDPTQGGQEHVIDPNVDQIGFQFWDGQEWDTTWDTTQTPPQPANSTGQAVLPEAVQVSYTLRGEAGSPVHKFVVPIPSSAITPQAPVTSGASPA